MSTVYNYSQVIQYRSPYQGLYHEASLIFSNQANEDEIPPIFKANLRSALENMESINSYYMLEVVNITILQDGDTLIGELIFSKRESPVYYQDYQNPTITPHIMKGLIKNLDYLNIGVIKYISSNLNLLIGDMQAPEVITITIKSQIEG